MGDSVLNSIKNLLGSDDAYDVYNPELVILINAAFAHLNELGAGPSDVFSISGAEETWDEFTSDQMLKAKAKEFVWLDVKLKFDPPTSSFVLKSFEDMRTESEWRIECYVSGK